MEVVIFSSFKSFNLLYHAIFFKIDVTSGIENFS